VPWKFAFDFSFWLIIIAGAMIGIINTIMVVVFELLPNFEMLQTYMSLSRL
jgi:hypothetical protein